MNAPATATTNTTTVTVHNPDQAYMARSAQSAIALVEAFEIVDGATFELAGEELKGIKRRAAELDEKRKSITKPLDDAKKAVMDLFRGPLDMLTKAEGLLKGKMLDYQREEQRKANEARIAAERAAQAERDRLAREAAALKEEGKHGEAALKEVVAEMVAPAAVQVAEAPKVAGVSTRTTVDFEVDDLLALVQHVGAHPELLQLLQVDSVKLRAYVKSLGMSTKLPGVRVFEKQTLAAGR